MPMSKATYAARKARGVCRAHATRPAAPGHVYCTDCLDRMTTPATRDHMHLVHAHLPGRGETTDRAAVREYAGPQIAHCGQWHAVTALPWRCPVCDTLVLSEVP